MLMNPDELFEHYLFWRHEGLSPITSIEGYAMLLLENPAGELSEEQRQWLDVILRNSREARRRWKDFGEYLRVRYQIGENTHPPVSLAEGIQNALTALQGYSFPALPEAVEIEIPAILQSAKIQQEFENVFFYLLAPAFKLIGKGGAMSRTVPRITASEGGASAIRISIRSAICNFHVPADKIGDLPYPDTDISLAHLILMQNDIPLSVEIVSGAGEEVSVVDFYFTLPVCENGPQGS